MGLFFSIKPEDVGKPHKQEISQLKDLFETEKTLQKKFARRQILWRVFGTALLIIAVIFIAIPLINTVLFVNQPSEASSINAENTSGIFRWWYLCCFSTSVPVIGGVPPN